MVFLVCLDFFYIVAVVVCEIYGFYSFLLFFQCFCFGSGLGGLDRFGDLWGALGCSGRLREALSGSLRLWEALGGSVSRRDTREIHKGLIAYIPATYLLKTQGNRPGDSYRTYCLHSFLDIY